MRISLGQFVALLLIMLAFPCLAANMSGASKPYFNAALSNTPVAVSTSAGSLQGFSFVNKGGADAYVQVFDLATGSITLGTTPPTLSFWVPAGGGLEEKFTGETKIGFYNRISMAATTTPTGSAAPATALVVNIEYK